MMTRYIAPRRQMARRYAPAIDARRFEVHIPVDVTAEDEAYTIKAFVPGVAAEDVKIEVLGDLVTISGEFPAEEGEDTRYLLRERPNGAFSRSLRLPLALDAGGAQAEVKDGILSLRVPQAEEAKAKQIKVKVK